MARPIEEFPDHMRAIIRHINDNAVASVQGAAARYTEFMVGATPIKTGKAVSNWEAQVDSIPIGENEAHFPGEFGSTAEVNVEITKDRAADAIAFMTDPKQFIAVANNTSYIGDIRSPQGKQLKSTANATALQLAVAGARGNVVVFTRRGNRRRIRLN